MNKKLKSWEPSNTLIINLDGQTIAVDTLPSEIKFEISTYDKIIADYLKILYEHDKIHLAMNAKYAQIVNMIKSIATPSKPEEKIGETNDNGKG